MKTISCIIPTLWIPDEFQQTCDILANSIYIHEIIIINNKNNSKNIDFSKYGKIEAIDSISYNQKIYGVESYGKFKILTPPDNVYVTEAWNIGVEQSTSDIVCLLNDDIIVTNDIFEYVTMQMNNTIGIIGLHKKCLTNVSHVLTLNSVHVRPEGFGCCMFLERSKYKKIPEILKIWYNDDYLFAHVQGNHFTLSDVKVKGSISKTIFNKELKQHIKKIIDDDFRWFVKIKNGML